MKRALVVGCSENVWAEVEEAKSLTTFDKIYCVKIAGIHWPTAFDVWATLHPEFMDGYEAERKALGLPGGYEIVAPPPEQVGMHGAKGNIARRVNYRWPGMTSSGSSGMFGIKIALDDGMDQVITAGCPMTADTGHFTRKKPWLQRDSFTGGWEKGLPFMKGKVKSISGWSRETLGYPTQAWLNGEPE